MEQGLKNMAIRLELCLENFIENVIKQGFDRNEAIKIFNVYKKHKIIKRDLVNKNYIVKHGAFWASDVLRNALNEA